MAQDGLEVVRDIYDAFGSGDMDRVAALIVHTDWHEAEGALRRSLSGSRRSVSERLRPHCR